jgi:hypothetical protein
MGTLWVDDFQISLANLFGAYWFLAYRIIQLPSPILKFAAKKIVMLLHLEFVHLPLLCLKDLLAIRSKVDRNCFLNRSVTESCINKIFLAAYRD